MMSPWSAHMVTSPAFADTERPVNLTTIHCFIVQSPLRFDFSRCGNKVFAWSNVKWQINSEPPILLFSEVINDNQIVRYVWSLLDYAPNRPSGAVYLRKRAGKNSAEKAWQKLFFIHVHISLFRVSLQTGLPMPSDRVYSSGVFWTDTLQLGLLGLASVSTPNLR